ncbi:uncharacterized protein LOC129795895 isoform X2 [Lutzomyia longipalpis]|uniref:Putative conserved secreted protein n=1 Tax=Lutzomyia longipalpis TaxID=7200 RepID=A0A7G3AHF4_LUTLO|nr:uncharacterized protein LOC129795895 isoform X2 [Lutzomyia longipalpis]XP_055693412.1 uncharacterized protein LOC129795895 isoform X2 [Lutzomyia longipalpis]XP_055693414.1 uncharacterized protein LOC129795895 isoform X2 [Lutzomyia longipalpis]
MFRPHIIVIPLILATGILAVQIHEVKVPSTYILDEDNDEPLILDCIYDIDPTETGFVLKWLLNERPVYQWIPSVGSFALPLLKNRIDASYEVSQETKQKHRALAIVKPSWNITGNYTCSVQTFESSDKKSAHLQIVVPEKNFHLKHHCCDEDDTVDIICSTSGIYPEPKLIVLLNDDAVGNQVANRSRADDDGHYEVIVNARVPRQKMESPTTIKCILTIPGTSYSRKKESIFYGGGSANRASIIAGIILPLLTLLLHLT